MSRAPWVENDADAISRMISEMGVEAGIARVTERGQSLTTAGRDLEDVLWEIEQRLKAVEEMCWIGQEPKTPEEVCAQDGHDMANVSYDLQGRKWGVERCRRCGFENSWSV